MKSNKVLELIAEGQTYEKLKCEFCDGIGERSHDSDGQAIEYKCSFCDGTGIDAEALNGIYELKLNLGETKAINDSYADQIARLKLYLKNVRHLKTLLRETSMRCNIAMPENEQDVKWFEEEITSDFIQRVFTILKLGEDKALRIRIALKKQNEANKELRDSFKNPDMNFRCGGGN